MFIFVIFICIQTVLEQLSSINYLDKFELPVSEQWLPPRRLYPADGQAGVIFILFIRLDAVFRTFRLLISRQRFNVRLYLFPIKDRKYHRRSPVSNFHCRRAGVFFTLALTVFRTAVFTDWPVYGFDHTVYRQLPYTDHTMFDVLSTRSAYGYPPPYIIQTGPTPAGGPQL